MTDCMTDQNAPVLVSELQMILEATALSAEPPAHPMLVVPGGTATSARPPLLDGSRTTPWVAHAGSTACGAPSEAAGGVPEPHRIPARVDDRREY